MYYRIFLKNGGELIIHTKEELDMAKVFTMETVKFDKIAQVFLGQSPEGVVKMNQPVSGVESGHIYGKDVGIIIKLTQEKCDEMEGKNTPKIAMPNQGFVGKIGK